MSLWLLVIWAIVVTCLTFFGSFYAKIFKRADLLIGLYVVFILCAQILASKISAFDLGFKVFFVPGGVLVFSVTYLFTDIVNEKFGRKETQRMIMIAFFSQIVMVLFFWMGTMLVPAPFWSGQSSWNQIFGFVPRITLASWIAFLVSEYVDAYIFTWFRIKTKGKHLWMRNSLSSIPALLLDSLIFIPIAFLGIAPIMPLIFGQTIIKWIVGIINVPFMYLNKIILGSENEII